MTPAQYANAFRRLRVFLDGDPGANPPPTPLALPEPGRTPPSLMQSPRQEFLDVKSYLLVSGGGAPSKPYYGKFGPALKSAQYIEAKIFRVDGTIETRSFQYREIAYSLVTPFWGKGYPEECQLALQLWDRLGLGPPDVRAMVAENGSIGLDCNGFVGGFLERNRNPAQWLRSGGSMTGAPINELLRLNGAFLNSLADFVPATNQLMLMARCDANTGIVPDYNSTPVGHIVITEPGTAARQADGAVTITVSESTARVGIVTSVYTIRNVVKTTASGAIFSVQRGSKKGMPEEFDTFKARRLT